MRPKAKKTSEKRDKKSCRVSESHESVIIKTRHRRHRSKDRVKQGLVRKPNSALVSTKRKNVRSSGMAQVLTAPFNEDDLFKKSKGGRRTIRPLNILVIGNNHSGGLDYSLTTEVRSMINMFISLKKSGHNTSIIYVCQNSARYITGEYDVCIMDAATRGLNNIKAKLFLFCSYHPEVVKRIYSSCLKAVPAGAVAKICLLSDLRYLYPSSASSLKHADYLPMPVFYCNNQPNSFDRKELIWVGKHKHKHLNPYISRLLNIFKRYEDYKMVFAGPFSNDILNLFQGKEEYYSGFLPYHELINRLARSKMALTCYYTGSIRESIVNGCMPLVWQTEEHESLKGGGVFVRPAEDLGCIFSLNDSDRQLEKKIDLLMTNRGYYEDVLGTFQGFAQEHREEIFYENFERIVKSAIPKALS